MAPGFSLESPLRDFYRRCYRIQRLPGGSEKTDFQYEVQFRHFDRWLERIANLGDLSDETVGSFLANHQRTRSARTANKAYYCLTALWRHAADLRLVDKRPTLRPFKEPDRVPMAWYVEEIQMLLRTCALQVGLIDRIPAANWWLGIHWVWWSTGERCSAALLIKTHDVDLRRGNVLIRAEDRKGKTADRLYPLLPQAVEAVDRIWSNRRQLLFPWPYCLGTFYNRYEKILLQAGLPTDRYSKPQRMRRSFASHLHAAGGDATTALGHSSPKVTRKSYLDPRICGTRNPAELLPRIEWRIDPPDDREKGLPG